MKNIRSLSFAILLLISAGLHAQTGVTDHFPDVTVNLSNSPSHGYFFIGSKSVEGTTSKYYAVIDNYGTPVFFRKSDEVIGGIIHHDNGKTGVMSGVPRKLHVLDENMEELYVITTEGYGIDPHSWAIDDNGHVILLGRDLRAVDMSQIYPGGNPDAQVKDLIIQEFDENQNLLYTWNSADYFDILDCEGSPFVDLTSDIIDYVHVNAVYIDSDTGMLISSRHMDEITRISRTTGDIIWRLGGLNNMFTFENDTIGFSHQHSVKKLDNGNILLFDNGNTHDTPISSVVEYEIDETNMTATLVRRIYHNPPYFVGLQGYAQQETFGNYIASWGPNINSASVTEFNADGHAVLELNYTSHTFSTKNGKHLWETTRFDFDADTIDFGVWNGSAPEEMTLEITNTYTQSIEINNFSNHSDYFTLNETLPVEIAASESAQITLQFNPEGSESTYFHDVMTISHDTDSTRDGRQVWLFGRTEDAVNPMAEIAPTGADIAIDTVVTVSFNEPVRINNSEEFSYANAGDYFVFKEGDENGAEVDYSILFNSEKTVFTLYPTEPLQEASQYYVSYSDMITDYSGNSVTPNESYFTTVGYISVEQLAANRAVISPNPAHDFITVSAKSELEYVRIYDLSGKKVFEEAVQGTQSKLKVNSLPQGVYILKITDTEQQIYTGKLILN